MGDVTITQRVNSKLPLQNIGRDWQMMLGIGRHLECAMLEHGMAWFVLRDLLNQNYVRDNSIFVLRFMYSFYETLDSLKISIPQAATHRILKRNGLNCLPRHQCTTK